MSQLGRIGGQVLTDNLLRAGIDLAFQSDLLYLKVSPVKTGVSLNEDADPNYGKPGSTSLPATAIGINTDVPIYTLDVNSNIRTNDLTVVNTAAIGNLRINAPDTFSTSVGKIDVYINGSEIWHDRLTTANLVVDGNKISSVSNSNIVFDPNASGAVNLLSDTYVTGDVAVTGNIRMSGDLTTPGTLTIGDTVYDTVTVNTDFTQDIVLGDNELYTLGTPTKRWNRVYQEDWTIIGLAGSGIITQNVVISDQIKINGTTSTITALQSNDDVMLNTSSGITQLERIAFEGDNITNLNTTPLQISSTGQGYVRFAGTNGFIIPAGNTSQRSSTPEVGETRWNTEEAYLECFDGNIWSIATGGGATVTQDLMQDIGNIWNLVLG